MSDHDPAEIAWTAMRAAYGKGLLTWAMLPPALREAFRAGVTAAVEAARKTAAEATHDSPPKV